MFVRFYLMMGISLVFFCQATPLLAENVLEWKGFKGDNKLKDAANLDSAHIKQGDRGPHVSKIQHSIKFLDSAFISQEEMDTQTYGPSTAKAVLGYKTSRKIINQKYQSKPDSIVGKMTMVALDREMSQRAMERFEDLKFPAAMEPFPSNEAKAPDGFSIPIPKTITRSGNIISLRGARVTVTMGPERASSCKYRMVIDNVPPETHNDAQLASEAADHLVEEAAWAVILDKAAAAITFGSTKVGIGVSAAAALIVPSPILREIVWHADVDGRKVCYLLVTQ